MAWFLAFMALPIVKTIAIGVASYFIAKPAIEKWADTLGNRGKKLGISESEAVRISQMSSKEKKDFIERDNELLKEKIKRIDKLEEQYTQMIKRAENESDPQEKAKILLAAKEIKKEIAEVRKEVKDDQDKMRNFISDLPSGNLNTQQVQTEMNKPPLGNMKTWGLIGVAVISAIMLLSIIKRFLTKALGDMTKE